MVEKRQNRTAVGRIIGPAGPKPPAARPGMQDLTPKEAFGILRRHILLVITTTILGLVIGGVGCIF